LLPTAVYSNFVCNLKSKEATIGVIGDDYTMVLPFVRFVGAKYKCYCPLSEIQSHANTKRSFVLSEVLLTTKGSFRQKEKGCNNTEQKIPSKRTSNTENVKEQLYRYKVQPKGKKREKFDEVKFSTKFNLNKIRLLVNKRVLSVL